MNRKAIINGREYALLEIVPSLDGGQALLLCEDENGKRAACSESLWRSCALKDVQSAPVHATAPHRRKSSISSLFSKGGKMYMHTGITARPPGKPVTPLSAKMNGCMACAIKRNTGAQSVPDREFRPLTADVVKAHLIGRDALCRDVAAIYPMLEDNRPGCWLRILMKKTGSLM